MGVCVSLYVIWIFFVMSFDGTWITSLTSTVNIFDSVGFVLTIFALFVLIDFLPSTIIISFSVFSVCFILFVFVGCDNDINFEVFFFFIPSSKITISLLFNSVFCSPVVLLFAGLSTCLSTCLTIGACDTLFEFVVFCIFCVFCKFCKLFI